MIGALRPRIDPSRPAVWEAKGWPLFGARGMGMAVKRTGNGKLAARIDGFGRRRRDVGLDGGDAPARDGHVADCTDPQRRIDDAPALDNQIVARGRCRRERSCSPGECQCARSACHAIDKLAPVDHRYGLPTLFDPAYWVWMPGAPQTGESKIRFARFRHRFDFIMEIIGVVLGAIRFGHGTRLDAAITLHRVPGGGESTRVLDV